MQVQPVASSQGLGNNESLMAVTIVNLELVSRMSSNIVISQLSRALLNNQASVQSRFPELSGSDGAIRTVEGSITAIVNDLLLGQAMAQTVVSKSIDTAATQQEYKAIQIGETRFIYATTAIKGLLIFLVVFEVCRTRFWSFLPLIDFKDIPEYDSCRPVLVSRAGTHHQ